jgi:hypothetical protein
MLKKRRIPQNFTQLFAHIQYFLLPLCDIMHESPQSKQEYDITTLLTINFINQKQAS